MHSYAFVLKLNFFFGLNELFPPYKIVHTALFFWGPQNQTFQKTNLSPGIYSSISRLKGLCSATLGYRFLLLLSKTPLSHSCLQTLVVCPWSSLSSVYGWTVCVLLGHGIITEFILNNYHQMKQIFAVNVIPIQFFTELHSNSWTHPEKPRQPPPK